MQRANRFACQGLLLAGTILTSSLLAPSWATANEDITTLDTVTVVATKTAQSTADVPAMVDVIDTDSASLQGATTLSDIFLNIPSVQFSGSGRRNGQNINMRGFNASSILVQFDGVRQNYQSGHDGRYFIDPSLVKSVEVVRGSSSSLYGSGAVGGVVAFETVQAQDLLREGENAGAEASVNYGSVNHDFTETLKAYGRHGNFDGIFALTKADSGDIELGDGNELVADDDLWSGVANGNWYIDEHSTLSAGFTGYSLDAEESNNPQIGADEDGGTDYADKTTKSYTARLRYAYENADHAFLNNFSIQTYYTNTDVNETLLVATTLGSVGDEISRELDTYGINIDNQTYFTDTIIGDHIVSYGFDYYSDDQDGGDTGNADGSGDGIPDAEGDAWGFYLQDEFAFNQPLGLPGELTIIPGVRYDSYESNDKSGNSQDKNKLSPKIATSYQPLEWLTLFGSYAEAFRAPNLTEIYSSGTHFAISPFGVNQFVPNTDLRPETSETVEIGTALKFADVLQDGDKMKFKVARYWTEAEDFIDLDVNVTFFPTCCGTSTNVNIPRAKLKGWDVNADYETTNWRLGLAYTEVSGTNQEIGEYLTTIIPPTLTANVEYKRPEDGLVTGFRSRFAHPKHDVNDADDRIGGYGVHDVYATWNPTDLPNLTLNAGIDNVFDKNYETVFAGAKEPGRNFKLGASWKF